MDLTDLQVELRKLETQLSALNGEIEKMKPKGEEKIDVDFKAITKLSNSHSICRQKLQQANGEVKKLIFSSLAFIIVQSDESISNKLLYLCRIANGSGFLSTAEELYTLGLKFSTDDLEVLISSIGEEKYSYLAELFIIAHIDGESSKEEIYAIADVANMMALDKEDLQAISLIAKSVLTNHGDYLLNIPIPNTNKWSGQFNDYISETWLASQRKIVKTIPKIDNKVTEFLMVHYTEVEQYIPNGNIVLQGEILAKCQVDKRLCTSIDRGPVVNRYNIEAECSGIVAIVEYEKEVGNSSCKNTDIIIGSCFDTYEQILAWHQNTVKE